MQVIIHSIIALITRPINTHIPLNTSTLYPYIHPPNIPLPVSTVNFQHPPPPPIPSLLF